MFRNVQRVNEHGDSLQATAAPTPEAMLSSNVQSVRSIEDPSTSMPHSAPVPVKRRPSMRTPASDSANAVKPIPCASTVTQLGSPDALRRVIPGLSTRQDSAPAVVGWVQSV